MTADAATDYDLITGNDAMLNRCAQFAQTVSVATGAVEVIDTQIDGPTDEKLRFFVRDRTEIVAKSLCPEGDDGDGQARFSPTATGTSCRYNDS